MTKSKEEIIEEMQQVVAQMVIDDIEEILILPMNILTVIVAVRISV